LAGNLQYRIVWKSLNIIGLTLYKRLT